jgi:hypothetical protein
VEFAFGGSLDYGVRRSHLVGAFERNMTSIALKMFPHLIYVIETFYNVCTYKAIYKYNAAINYITLQHKTDILHSALKDHTTVVHVIQVSWGSSVSIVSDYRLDDQGSMPGGGKEFFP